MLNKIHFRTDPEVSYRDGQEPIVHLEADLLETVEWAEFYRRRWTFSLTNAAMKDPEFRTSLADLNQIDWNAVTYQGALPKEANSRRQAEFLIYQYFPWVLTRRIGVYSREIAAEVAEMIASARHRPDIEVRRDWYY